MPRQMCNQCQRPVSACICDLFVKTNNQIHIVIIQHPSEVAKHKGSVTLLANSLLNCQVITTDNLGGSDDFQRVLATYKQSIGVLYPSEEAKPIETAVSDNGGQAIKCLILIDGTWKKAYRLYMENTQLHLLPHFTFSGELNSLYVARKTEKKGALSTLEACCHALSLLENEQHKYTDLMDSFVAFNQRLLNFSEYANRKPN